MLAVRNDGKKNRLTVRNDEFKRPQVFKRILAQAKVPLKDAAAVNTTCWALFELLKATNLLLETGSGGRTRYHQAVQNYPKAHWIDAACVGESGEKVKLNPKQKPLFITATGRGRRQVVKMDRYGFPRTSAGRIKRVHGFQTGDLVRLLQPKGKYAGIHKGRLAGIRADGRLDLQTPTAKITAPWHRFILLQRMDGYAYA